MEGITLTLSKEKSEELFYNALCNGLNYFCSCAGFDWDINKTKYKEAKQKLIEKGIAPCLEDVIMEALRIGATLDFRDLECDGEFSKKVSISDIHNNVKLTPTDHLMDMVNENDDATTAYILIQAVMYDGKIIFA